MAKKKKEEVVENATEDNVTKVSLKKQTNEDDNIIKVDLTKKPETDAVPEQSTDQDPVRDESETSEKVLEENVETTDEKPTGEEVSDTVQDEQPVLEEVTEEEVEEKIEEQVENLAEQAQDAMAEAQETGKAIPENLQKVVDFMEETGGTLEDYVRLNQDFSSYDDMTVLREYYKQTKSHLTDDEISFLIEDSFTVDEEIDGEKDVKRKKLAFKEQVAHAKTHLDGLKSTYYKEIKSGVKLTTEQQKAIDFFNRYNKESKESQKLAEKQQNVFQEKTNNVFNNNFKGFEYNVGDKKYRFNVSDVNNIKGKQSDLAPWLSEYVDKNNILNDAKGYHKSLFTAMNADAVATHFYQQGKADGVKEITMDSKNINMDPRKTGSQEVDTGGVKYKVISGDDSNKLRFKINK